jgi:hypothetical protein
MLEHLFYNSWKKNVGTLLEHCRYIHGSECHQWLIHSNNKYVFSTTSTVKSTEPSKLFKFPEIVRSPSLVGEVEVETVFAKTWIVYEPWLIIKESFLEQMFFFSPKKTTRTQQTSSPLRRLSTKKRGTYWLSREWPPKSTLWKQTTPWLTNRPGSGLSQRQNNWNSIRETPK